MHAYERWVLQRYLARALSKPQFARPPSSDADILSWIERYHREAGIPPLPAGAPARNRREVGSVALPRGCWARWRASATSINDLPTPRPFQQERRIRWLCAQFDLDPVQGEYLGLLARLGTSKPLLEFVEALNNRSSFIQTSLETEELAPLLPSCSAGEDASSLRRLAELGLVDTRDGIKIAEVVRRIFALPRLNSRSVLELMLGPKIEATLDWNSFAHLGEVRELAERIVRAAAKSPRSDQGVNLLLYGAPGSGKTEFAKTLGAKLGLSVHFLGESGPQGAEPERRERIAALMLANAIGGFRRKALLVVDEADDLFVGVDDDDGSARRGSKVFMNRLIESAVAPTIWIANDPSRLGSAMIRRMTLAIRFPKPGLAARKTIVAQIAEALEMPLTTQAFETLAGRPASPALVATALRTTKLVRGSTRDACVVLDAGLRALGEHLGHEASPFLPYDPSLSAANLNLVELADQVARAKISALSFCLSGPPGTGKSAYARYLAERLNCDVLERRYSDIVSKYVGDSEKAIAQVFEEAADQRAFLILDEADSLLRERRCAQHSWEVTQVNEMLTQLERHPYPIACTTNTFELLDEASARRFQFKVEFLSMSREQIQLAFRRFFEAEAPTRICELESLTPADFANVARRINIVGYTNITQVADWLEDEVSAKQTASRRIGF
jgi:SpoVK/Ycf46/Vps4 family AAA+-type ATPase